MKKLIFTLIFIACAFGAYGQKIGSLDVSTPSDVDSTSRVLINANPSGNKLTSLTVGSLMTDYSSTYGLDLYTVFPALADTSTHITFALGSGQTADTAVFAANAKCGSWKNNSSDTLAVASLWGIIDSALVDASVTVQISWADTLNAAIPTNLNSSPFTIDNEAVGNTDTSFANFKIPPGAIVKGTVGAVTLGAKPCYLQFQIDCYRIPKY